MKKVVSLFLVIALSLPVVASAAQAATGKNACLLNSENCTDHQAYSAQEMIARLEIEVAKGASVYSAAELRILQAKSADYQMMLVALTSR